MFASLPPYYANRKRAKRTRPRRMVEGSTPTNSSESAGSKRSRRDYLMSYDAVADIVRRTNAEDNKCCGNDCLNAVFTPQSLRNRRVRMHMMDQVQRCNFMVNEISAFAVVTTNR